MRWEVGPGTLKQSTMRLCGVIIETLVERPADNINVQGFSSLTSDGCPTQTLDTTVDGVVEDPAPGFNCEYGYSQFENDEDGIFYCCRFNFQFVMLQYDKNLSNGRCIGFL